MGLYKRGRIWWMAYSLNGRKVNESSHTSNRRVAQRGLDRILGGIAEGRLHLPRITSAPKLAQFSQQFLSEILQPNTKKRYATSARKLCAAFGDIKLCDVGIEEIEAFVAARKRQGVSPATINRDLAVLRRMLKVAQKRRYLVLHPFDQVQMLNETCGRRQARILAYSEEARIFSVLPVQSYFAPLIRVLLDTGLRVYSEALCLRWNDIDFDNHSVHVRHSKTAAGIRTVPLTTQCEASLLRWRDFLANTSEYVFPNMRKQGAYLRDIHRSWKAVLINAGVPDIWLHDLRATFATRLGACGLSILQIAQLLGHSSGRIVGTYAKALDEGKREAISLLERYSAAQSELSLRIQ